MTGRVIMSNKDQFAIFRLKKLHMDILNAVHAHNQRLIPVPHINTTPKFKNIRWTFDGSNKTTKQLVSQHLAKFPTMRVQKNSVVANELMLTASPEFFDGKSKKQVNQWIKTNYKWLKRKFGDNLLEISVHYDEQTIHAHATLSMVASKTKKKRRTKAQILANMSAKTYTNASLCSNSIFNRKGLKLIQTEYAEAMSVFGLKRGRRQSGATHKEVKTYHAEVQELDKVKFELTKAKIELHAKKQEISKAQKRLAYINAKANQLINKCFEPLKRAFEIASAHLSPTTLKIMGVQIRQYEKNKQMLKNVLSEENLEQVEQYIKPMKAALK
ncbi:MAG: hypothetical protein COB83_12660 [Gammaproteobacteria bacterium]|nr:MAG: hypothetical protein COB83_12660 [Gammaproteobacteria bacterium]